MKFYTTWHLLSIILLINVYHIKSQCGSSSDNKLVQYKILLKTYWSRERFPKQYPQWSPSAQFGRLIGKTHDSSYFLYHLGKNLPSGTMDYLKNENSNDLNIDGEISSVLDTFGGTKLLRGEGTSITRAFLDSNHTLISIIMRINPSPDWFIGIDSFSLCVKGRWIDTVTLELDPLDGGIDNGLTFKSKSGTTNLKNFVYRITSRYPAHHTSSFYYPNLPRLPPIATLTFQKLKEYTLNDAYHRQSKHHQNHMYFVTNDNKINYRYWIDDDKDLKKLKIIKEQKNKKNSKNNKKHYRLHLPRDCAVSEWSSWSACTRTCGVGETQRLRKIIVKPRRTGAPCPTLKDIKWCGSIKPCKQI
ncbi:spondin-2-like [Aphidius gifuensis]|uniref:spondin-2-like n=1 Tax=Aphidius gifuensis TaxID=684658 RepID=UPI001CDC5722|nr:spondin-2-like [Aphidius gifuensis]